MNSIEHIYHQTCTHPNRIILSDAQGEYTYRQLWELSGRVYAYLLSQGIGREDCVLVHLPRSAEAVMTMIGVFRTGAAVVMLEDWGHNDWVDFVLRDVQPCLTINLDTMDSIRSLAPKEGYHTPDLHDLAYIAYTTGTTGQSKGVMHEYGTLERVLQCYLAQAADYDITSDRIALVTTLHTSIPSLVIYIAVGTYIDLVPHEVYSDPQLFHQQLVDKHITYTYLSPVYLHQNGMLDAPDLRYVSVSFEPATSVYSDKVMIFNDYGMRETGGSICEFQVDQCYDITPIGKPLPPFQIAILDDHDQPVPDGELGEIVVDNVYCRGYLHLPEVTAEHFRNGYYYTHDLGKRLPDGNYIMYGRINDAFLTKQGLIIALEIEVAARKVLGRASAYVKIFPANDQPIICLYTDFPIDFAAVQASMRAILPAYKVPTDHVQVDHFEYNNGKAIRVHLTNPRV